MLTAISIFLSSITLVTGVLAIERGRHLWDTKQLELMTEFRGRMFLFLWASTGWSFIHILSLAERPPAWTLLGWLAQAGVSVILILAHMQARFLIRK